MFLLVGMTRWVNGESLDTPAAGIVMPLSALDLETTMDAVEEGQDYEIVVDFQVNGALDFEKMYGKLEKMGTSIQLGEGDGIQPARYDHMIIQSQGPSFGRQVIVHVVAHKQVHSLGMLDHKARKGF